MICAYYMENLLQSRYQMKTQVKFVQSLVRGPVDFFYILSPWITFNFQIFYFHFQDYNSTKLFTRSGNFQVPRSSRAFWCMWLCAIDVATKMLITAGYSSLNGGVRVIVRASMCMCVCVCLCVHVRSCHTKLVLRYESNYKTNNCINLLCW